MGQGGGRVPPPATVVAAHHPKRPLGVARGHPLALFFFLKKKLIIIISVFIYFLINLYYFIKMCMSAPRVANKMATRGILTESVKNLNRI
jgi:hypothetical protein